MNRPSVLIADDDDVLLRVLTVRCRNLGLEVRTAPDAMMALTIVHKDPPSVLILDITMPAGNGIGVLEMIRSDRRLAQILVVVLSGTSDDALVDRCEQLGAHFIRKSPDAWVDLKVLLEPVVENVAPADEAA